MSMKWRVYKLLEQWRFSFIFSLFLWFQSKKSHFKIDLIKIRNKSHYKYLNGDITFYAWNLKSTVLDSCCWCNAHRAYTIFGDIGLPRSEFCEQQQWNQNFLRLRSVKKKNKKKHFRFWLFRRFVSCFYSQFAVFVFFTPSICSMLSIR